MVALMQEEKSGRQTMTVPLPEIRRKLASGKLGARVASGTAEVRVTAAPGPGDALHEFRLSLEVVDAHYVPEPWAPADAVRLIQEANVRLAEQLTGVRS
jgi:hypothetical protein